MKQIFFSFLVLFLATNMAFSQITVFPWVESFEDDSPTIGEWTQQYVNGNLDWTFDAGAGSGSITSAYDGSKNARFVAVNSPDELSTYLISPVLDLSAYSNPELSFWYGQQERMVIIMMLNNQLRVKYRTSPTGDWTLIQSFNIKANSWTQASLVLPNPSATYQIAFEGVNKFAYPNVLDKIVVSGGLNCSAPSDIALSNIVFPTADIEWTDNSGAALWNLKVSTSPINPESENGNVLNTTTGSNPYNISPLQAGTTYYIYVQADCGGGELSPWSTGIYTPAGDCSDPFVVSLPDVAELNPYTITGSTCGFGNNYSSGSCGGNWANNEDVVYRLDVNELHTLTINFTTNTVGAGIGLYNACPETGDCLANEYELFSASNHTITIELEPGSYYLMISNQGSTSCINEFDLTFDAEVSPCPWPTNIHLQNVNFPNAELVWTDNAGASEWNVKVSTTPIDPETQTGNIFDNIAISQPLSLSGINEGTTYYLYVQANCGAGEFSNWRSGFYGPAGNCADPLIININNTSPYVINGTTCGYGDTYNNLSCGGQLFDNEDVVYLIDLDLDGLLSISLNTETTFAGFGLFSACPLTGECIAVTNIWGTAEITDLEILAGEYYLIIDNAGNFSDCIDLFELTILIDIEDCIAPSDINVEVTDISATVNWVSPQPQLSWNIRYGEGSFDPYNNEGTLVEGVASPYVISGLSPNTDYTFYIMSVCDPLLFDPAVSDWSTQVSFTTLCSESNLPIVQVFANPSTTQCPGTEIELSSSVTGGTGTYEYNWENGSSNISTYTVSPTQTTSYELVVTDSDGCYASANIETLIFEMPELSIIANPATTICPGSQLTLTYNSEGGSGTYTYEWSGGFGSNQTIVVNPIEPTVYSVIVSDENLCSIETSVSIEMYDLPSASINAMPSSTLCAGQNAILTCLASGGAMPYSYNWNNGTGSNANLSINPDIETVYSVVVTDNNLCTTESEITVYVNPIPTVNCPDDIVHTSQSPLLLTGAEPEGGFYTGLGVNSGYFNPAGLTNGNYNITYTYNDGLCANTCTFMISLDVQTDIHWVVKSNDLKIYPNPNNGDFTVSIDEAIREIRILDQLGQIVYFEIEPKTNSINISKRLSSGLYFIQIETDKSSYSKKFFIE